MTGSVMAIDMQMIFEITQINGLNLLRKRRSGLGICGANFDAFGHEGENVGMNVDDVERRFREIQHRLLSWFA